MQRQVLTTDASVCIARPTSECHAACIVNGSREDELPIRAIARSSCAATSREGPPQLLPPKCPTTRSNSCPSNSRCGIRAGPYHFSVFFLAFAFCIHGSATAACRPRHGTQPPRERLLCAEGSRLFDYQPPEVTKNQALILVKCKVEAARALQADT